MNSYKIQFVLRAISYSIKIKLVHEKRTSSFIYNNDISPQDPTPIHHIGTALAVSTPFSI